MHVVLAILLWMLMSVAPVTAADYEAKVGAQVWLEWDYTTEALACIECEGGAVDRFEVRVDANPYLQVGIPSEPTNTYNYLLPSAELPKGLHEIWIRACNSVECSGDVGVTIQMRGHEPRMPTGLRVP
jgi:hypothetical protein